MRALPAFLIAAALFAACGGSTPPAEEPKTREASPAVSPKTGAHAEESSAPARAGVGCDDGSCFTCGDAVCLSGFFCSAGKAGRGCAWLPSCPGKATCACVSPALREDPSCTCQEKGGGVYVACDGAKL